MGPGNDDAPNDVDEFERQIGSLLPKAYRNFILDWKEALPEERFFRLNDYPMEDEIWELSKLFDFRSLRSNWDVSSRYDMQVHRERLRKYITIGEEAGGGALLLELSTGNIKTPCS